MTARRRAAPVGVAARRVVVKVGSSSLTTAAGGLDAAGWTRWSTCSARRRAAGHPARAGLLRRDRRRPGAAGAAAPAARPRHPAGRGERRARCCWCSATPRRSPGTGSPSARCCSPPTTWSAGRTTATPSAPSSGCSPSACVPIVNENDTVATEEIRFGDNDRLAALVAHLLARRRAGAALRRRRPLRRRPAPAGRQARSRRCSGDADLAGVDRLGQSGPASAPAAWRPRSTRRASRTGAGVPVVLTVRRAGRRRAGRRAGRHAFTADRTGGSAPACSGCATPPRRAGGCSSTTGAVAAVVRAARVAAVRRHHRRSRATSSPATRSSWSARTASPSPAAWSATTRPSCRRCSASHQRRSTRSTAARSCTATILSSCAVSPRDAVTGRTLPVHSHSVSWCRF